jgi:hypothetical protein
MGNLISQKIKPLRVYRDPNAPVNLELDYDEVYPITTFSALRRGLEEVDVHYSFEDELKKIYSSIDERQMAVPAGYEMDIMAYTGEVGRIGGLKRVTAIDPIESNRNDLKVPTEAAVGKYADTKTSQVVFNGHRDDSGIHIKPAERLAWNDKTDITTFLVHDGDMIRHITADERVSWNNKANDSDFQAHKVNINNPHRVTAAQINCYTIPQINNMLENLETGFMKWKCIAYDKQLEMIIEQYSPGKWNPNFIVEHGHDWNNTPVEFDKTYLALEPATDPGTVATDYVKLWVKRDNMTWRLANPSTAAIQNGDMFITYPDNEVYIWIGGKFKKVTTI